MSERIRKTISITRMATRQVPEGELAGKTTEAELIGAFHAPSSGVFLLQPRALRWIVRLHLGIRSVIGHVPHPESYTLPVREFAECLQRYDSRLHDQVAWTQVPGPDVTLLAMPARALRQRHSLPYFALRLWSARFGGAIAVQCRARREGDQFNELLMRQCIRLIGPVRFEEVRDVLVEEQRLNDPSDDMEVLFEFAAHYLQLRYFSPLELFGFYPSLKGHDEAVSSAMGLIGVDAEAALHGSRMPETPTVQELVLGARQGLRQRRYEDEKAYDPAHRARLLMSHPLLAESIRDVSRDEQLAIQSLVRRVTERLIQPGGLLGKIDFQGVRDLAVKLGLDIELAQLLVIDRVLADRFEEQYTPSSRWQRLQLASRSSRAIAEDRDSAERRGITRATLQRFLAVLEGRADPLYRRRWWLLYYLLGGWLVEWWSRRLALLSPAAESVADRFRLARFQIDYEEAQQQQQVSLSRSMIAMQRAGNLLVGVCDRTDLPEADQALDRLNTAYHALISPFGDYLAGNEVLPAEQRDQLERLIDYLVHRVSARDHGVAAQMLLELERSHLRGLQVVHGFDLLGWLLSFGRRPLVVELPLRGRIRRLEHLRKAQAKAGQLPLPEQVLESYTGVIHQACHNAEQELRGALEPVLEQTFEEIGFLPSTPQEQIAYLKLREELLRGLVERGYSHYSTLRDALSRNNLKLADWRIWELIRGDHLSQLDRELGLRLPGIHHRGELYLKLFHLPMTMGFGTSVGRIIVRGLLLPFAAAATLMVLIQMSLGHALPLPDLRDPRLLALLGFSLGLLIHLAPLRRLLALLLWHPLKLLYKLSVKGIVALPLLVKSVLVYPALGTVVSVPLLFLTRPQLFSHAPLVPGAPAYLTSSALVTAGCYLFWLLLACTPIGVFFGGVVADFGTSLIRAIGRGFLLRLYYLILGVSQAAMRQLERLNYRVTAALRWIKGEGEMALGLKALGTLLWFPFYYVTRLYVLLFLEPQINPLKFPAVSISYKIILPYYVRIQQATISFFGLLLPQGAATGVGGVFTFFSTGIFGFLFWELKENWKLYRSNASPRIKPIPVGSHGETIAAYLRPGFHSGTIPHMFRSRRQALARGGLGAARTLRQLSDQRHHILGDLTHFQACDLILPLNRHELFRDRVAVGQRPVEITANTITFFLTFAVEEQPLVLRLLMEEKNGVLIASARVVSGALDALSRPQQATLAHHLAVFYKLSAVDVLREEIEGYLSSAYPNHCLDDPEAPNQLLYDVVGKRLRLSFIEQRTSRSLSERMITAFFPRPTQRTIPLKDELRFGSRQLLWGDFNRLHEPEGYRLGEEHLYLLRPH